MQGHHAVSCDILPADDGETEFHIQGDAMRFMEKTKKGFWDLIVAHPPCTAMAVSGNAHYGLNTDGTPKEKHFKRLEAIVWTEKLWDLCCEKCDHVCFENPVSVLSRSKLGKATQSIQPWQFGHAESKRTCFWLHGLPKLRETDNVKAIYDKLPTREKMRIHYLPPSADRWKIRSKTFEGIADAITEQWGKELTK